MKVRVKLFAVAKELAGCSELTIDVPEGATISDLHTALIHTFPTLARIIPHALWAVGTTYASDDTLLNEQSSVALIPPVSGG
jgi:molybdopterin converting factor subunit 1